MTREEEIRQEGIGYTYRNSPMCIGGGVFSEAVDEMNRNKSFEEGAKWADRTMIERACRYLYKWNQEQTKKFGAKAIVGCSEYTINVADFKSAMKGD